MTYKSYVSPKAFAGAESIGLRVTTLGETFGKMRDGLFIGSLNLITVLFGLFSVKHVNIPIFLCLRRTAIAATLICDLVVNCNTPPLNKFLCACVMVGGGIVSGWENLDRDFFGYILVILNNFSQSIYVIMLSKFNADKRIVPFEINFFFAFLGLPICTAVVAYQGDLDYLPNLFMNGEFN